MIFGLFSKDEVTKLNLWHFRRSSDWKRSTIMHKFVNFHETIPNFPQYNKPVKIKIPTDVQASDLTPLR